jgi:Flp pilus assembly pilin Flp
VLQLTVAIQATLVHTAHQLARRFADERGQSTAEYALVLLGAAAVALLLVAWATKTDKVTKLFNAVIDRVLSQL